MKTPIQVANAPAGRTSLVALCLMSLLVTALMPSYSSHAAVFDPTITFKRDGSSEDVYQEWHGQDICKRWSFKYQSSGISPTCDYLYDFRLEESRRDPDTDVWGAWKRVEWSYTIGIPATPAEAASQGGQLFGGQNVDENGVATAVPPWVVPSGHCPGIATFRQEVFDYGEDAAVPFFSSRGKQSATDTWIYNPTRTVTSYVLVPPDYVVLVPVETVVTTWPTGTQMQAASGPGNGWTDYLVDSPEWWYWDMPFQGVIWLFSNPQFTRTYHNFGGTSGGTSNGYTGPPPPGALSVEATAPINVKPYFRSYSADFSILFTTPD